MGKRKEAADWQPGKGKKKITVKQQYFHCIPNAGKTINALLVCVCVLANLGVAGKLRL